MTQGSSEQGNTRFSVVVPVYCEAESLVELSDRVAAVFQTMDAGKEFEIVFVDDGSTDATPSILRALERERGYVRVLTHRRNFGKSLALMAGFRAARGRVVITMDGDLQDNPEDIPLLVAKMDEGYDLVSGWRRARHDGVIRKYGSRLFNGTVARATGLHLHDINCGFKAYSAEAAGALCVYGQHHRYIPLQAHLLGFRVTEAPVNNSERKYGTSKYRAFRYQGLFDLMSILFIYRFGLNPLHFFGVAGFLLMAPAVLVLAYLVGLHALSWIGLGDSFQLVNRPLFSLALTTLLLGMIVFLTGFVCDFILHHQIRSNMDAILKLNTSDRSEPNA